MSYVPASPSNFKVVNKDQDPSALVTLRWTAMTTAGLRSDYLTTNTAGRTTNSLDWLSAHYRAMIGYRLHKGSVSGFTPSGETAGAGNCIADETALTQPTVTYTDTAVATATEYDYKIVAIYNG